MDSEQLFLKLRPYLILWLVIAVVFIASAVITYQETFVEYISMSFESLMVSCITVLGIILMLYYMIFPSGRRR